MKLSLINIENQIREFFENRFSNASDRNQMIELTSLLFESIDKNILTLNGLNYAPSKYIVRIDAAKASYSPQIDKWKETVFELVQQILKEKGLHVASDIQIAIVWIKNPLIPIEVEAETPNFQSGNTIRIEKNSNAINDPSKSEKAWGFLVFPADEEFAIKKINTTIGRAIEADLSIDNLLISRFHARISIEDNQAYLSDMDSVRGTYVNGNKIQRQLLLPGDVISIGDVTMVFMRGDDPNETLSTNTKMI